MEETKMCQNCRASFMIDASDFNFYQKIRVPPPTWCPLCRAQRRFAWRNERKLFKVKDAFTGREIFSLTPAESGKKIVTQEAWHSDSWDGMDYGGEYDFSKTFFKQFFELYQQIPIYNLNCKLMVNSPYSGNATALKNCYLCFNSNHSEDCLYGNGIDFSKDCVDNSHVNHSERCYESLWLENCYQCYFSMICKESRNLYFCRSCLGCNDCFGCVGVKRKQYCVLNRQYTKDEYKALTSKIRKHMDDTPYIDNQGVIYKYGQFFPMEFSPLGYNNTINMQHFPVAKDEALRRGYTWIEVPRGQYAVTQKASELPDLIDSVTDEILHSIVECAKCKNSYRILENELTFLRREKLALPRMCNDCRYDRRISDRLKIQLYERSCMCAGVGDTTGVYQNTVGHVHGNNSCGEKFKTGYAPDLRYTEGSSLATQNGYAMASEASRLEIVYCEKCYQQEVY